MIDWNIVICNLRGSGLTNAAIASRLDCSKSTVDKWCRNERIPRNWVQLLDLHHDRCPDLHRPEVIGVP